MLKEKNTIHYLFNEITVCAEHLQKCIKQLTRLSITNERRNKILCLLLSKKQKNKKKKTFTTGFIFILSMYRLLLVYCSYNSLKFSVNCSKYEMTKAFKTNLIVTRFFHFIRSKNIGNHKKF